MSNKIIKYGIVFLFLTQACSSSSTDKVLNFFFDGVPKKDSLAVLTEIPDKNDSSISKVSKRETTVPVLFKHIPYEEGMCESCHNLNASYKIYAMPDLCYNCHTDFKSAYKNIHYPIESGECNICHNPHQAQLPKLLIKPVRELCFNCHDAEALFATDIHSEIGDADCTDCHDPHASNDDSLLR